VWFQVSSASCGLDQPASYLHYDAGSFVTRWSIVLTFQNFTVQIRLDDDSGVVDRKERSMVGRVSATDS
jgi:hypothetical protein